MEILLSYLEADITNCNNYIMLERDLIGLLGNTDPGQRQ
jgi:hypothetical protein